MTYEEYIEKYGMDNPWEEGWEDLDEFQREKYKQGFTPYEGPGEDAQAIWDDLYEQFQSGGPIDWDKLQTTIEQAGMSPGIRDWFINQTRKLITGTGTDFAKEYGVGKKALDVQLDEAVRGVTEGMAARGLLDSSAMAAGVGGAMGGYSRSLADLMMWKGQAEEQSRQFDVGAGMNLGGMGLNWAGMDVANQMNLAQLMQTDWAQTQGLGMDLLGYDAQQQQAMNQYNLSQMMNWGWDPMTGMDVAMTFGPPLINAWAGGVFGGGGGGGGGATGGGIPPGVGASAEGHSPGAITFP